MERNEGNEYEAMEKEECMLLPEYKAMAKEECILSLEYRVIKKRKGVSRLDNNHQRRKSAIWSHVSE